MNDRLHIAAMILAAWHTDADYATLHVAATGDATAALDIADALIKVERETRGKE